MILDIGVVYSRCNEVYHAASTCSNAFAIIFLSTMHEKSTVEYNMYDINCDFPGENKYTDSKVLSYISIYRYF